MDGFPCIIVRLTGVDTTVFNIDRRDVDVAEDIAVVT